MVEGAGNDAATVDADEPFRVGRSEKKGKIRVVTSLLRAKTVEADEPFRVGRSEKKGKIRLATSLLIFMYACPANLFEDNKKKQTKSWVAAPNGYFSVRPAVHSFFSARKADDLGQRACAGESKPGWAGRPWLGGLG